MVKLILLSFVDGQKIAKKLSLQISKETKVIKSLHEELKVCLPSTDDCSLSEALDPPLVEMRLHKLGGWGAIASGKKRRAIDAYLTLCRSNEEIEMLEQDARNCVKFYECQKEVITSELQRYSVCMDPFSRGATALLINLMYKTSQLLKDSIGSLEKIVSQIHLKEDNVNDGYETDDSTSSSATFDDY